MNLIPNWRSAWRMFSVQIATVAIAWGAMPADAQAAVLEAIGVGPERVPAALGLLFLAGRLIDQPKTRQPE
jgi:hypothetical protein